MNGKIKFLCWALPTACMLLTSCSNDSLLDDNNNSSEYWKQEIGGTSDAQQTWMTSVATTLNIVANKPSTISAYTIGQKTPVLLGRTTLNGNGVMKIDVPQGIGTSFGLYCDDEDGRKYKRIYLTGAARQTTDVDFTTDDSDVKTASGVASRKFAPKRSSSNSALYGSSINGASGYSSFGGWAWQSLSAALPEGIDAGTNANASTDYEWTSYGRAIYITFLYGFTGNYDYRRLGYYYHSDGDYSDMTFVDLTEALRYDYIDNQAKVQYQLDGKDTWYDANFDYADGFSKTTSYAARQGDDAYNTKLVYDEYGDRITGVRGLSFKIDVPAGKKFGFYLKLVDVKMSAEQKGYLAAAGVPEASYPKGLSGGNEIVCETNFSHKAFNTKATKASLNGAQYRSATCKYDNFTFVGLDDATSAGDMDCNDVTFGLLNADGKQYDPDYVETNDLQSWTIAYEDLGTTGDFDFNDAVIKIVPNTAHQAKVYLLAVGGTLESDLYFNGTKLCETHEGLAIPAQTMANTEGTKATIAPVLVGTVDLQGDYTIDQNRALFTLHVHNRDGSTNDISTDTYLNNGLVPQAICIAGDWQWPLEDTRISISYPMIGSWAQNINDSNYWNWYSNPKSGETVAPYE